MVVLKRNQGNLMCRLNFVFNVYLQLKSVKCSYLIRISCLNKTLGMDLYNKCNADIVMYTNKYIITSYICE